MANRIARMWNGSSWEVITSTAAAPNAIVSYQGTAPSSPTTGQVWIDSDDRIFYVWNGSSWVSANLDSPTFTGTPAAPTAIAGTNTTQIATTAYVTTAVEKYVISPFLLGGM
jgi:hypothetical protein